MVLEVKRMVSLTKRARPVLRTVNAALVRALPGYIYVRVARWIIPILDPNRRDFSSKLQSANGCYRFTSSTFTIYFHSPFNVGRYLYKDSEQTIFLRLKEKYLGKNLTVSSGDIVLDVGANVGEFAISMAKLGARVLAFEPDPKPYRCLNLNVSDKLPIRCFQIGLAGRIGSLPFFISSTHNDSSFIKPEAPHESVQEVTVTTLDLFCEENDVNRIKLLKIEAEGYEPEVLNGATKILSTIVDQVTVDAGPERLGEPTDVECTAILNAHGFTVVKVGNVLHAKRTLESVPDTSAKLN